MRTTEPRCPSSYGPTEGEDDGPEELLAGMGLEGARVVRSGGYWRASLGHVLVVDYDLERALRRIAGYRAAWEEPADG